jgi:hypothetical protein
MSSVNAEKSAQYRGITRALFALVLLLSASANGHEPDGVTCGVPGKPACPLQRWMRNELTQSVVKKDDRATADALERLATLNPEPKKWLNWTKFAREGARAAREGRASGVNAACAHCHSIYRGEYNIKYRRRAIR